MFKEPDRKNIETISDYIKVIYDRTKVSESDREELINLCWRAADAEKENAILKTKVELYEKFIAKMLESDPDKSNDTFMFDGDIYRLTDYHKYGGAGKPTTLTVEFRCVTGITKNFKEE